jgi:hypothetical protein
MITIPGLSAAIKGAIISEFGTPYNPTELQQFCDALATGIVPYLVSNNVVTASGTDSHGDSVTVTGSFD